MKKEYFLYRHIRLDRKHSGHIRKVLNKENATCFGYKWKEGGI